MCRQEQATKRLSVSMWSKRTTSSIASCYEDCAIRPGESPMATGTRCACGWAEAGVCSKDTVWSPDALFSLLQLACRIDSDHLPSWTSQVTTMLEQQGFSRIFWSANISITAILLFTNFVLICFFIYTKCQARILRGRFGLGAIAAEQPPSPSEAQEHDGQPTGQTPQHVSPPRPPPAPPASNGHWEVKECWVCDDVPTVPAAIPLPTAIIDAVVPARY